MLSKYINIPDELWKNMYHTGSSAVCNPPVLDTDIDYVIYTDTYKLESWLVDNGFKGSCKDYESGTVSLRKGILNIIIVDDYTFYKRWVLATDLAKRFNLLKKIDRISLFSAILYPIEE